MSRVGMLPIEVPEGVNLEIETDQVTAKGKLGELSMRVSKEVEVSHGRMLYGLNP